MSLCSQNIALWAVLFFFTTTVSAGDVRFKSDESVIQSSSGHVTLEWESVQDSLFEVQEAVSADFTNATLIYSGPDKASFVSGLEDGTYFFRVRAPGGTWSDTLTVHVQHQSLKLAFILFGLGGVVFLLTVFVVITGARRAAKNTL